ncbi:SH3 domain-containing protein [Devosia sediminis]|uniref:SH3 domain-containing protein n=1 Tax=Devosia sediminis TaxID=2798801 RepID=A0A934MG17_9HYPH|nr:SH3 domain-containing protein [Devosia sediminis]MBJ3783467.1 SH3 domain-containing protein [Devosia sediminis]
MALRKKLATSGLAALAVLATTAAAFAAPATATGSVNVRTGPGTGYAVVDTLRRGQQVEVQHCRGSWCFVEKRGPDGWVSANYLSMGHHGGWDDDWDNDWRPRPPRPQPPVWDPYPPRPPHWNPRPPRPQPIYPSNPGASMCFNGPNGYFCVGT